MDDMELIAFEIISNAGMGKSLIIEAIREGRRGNYELANQKVKEANEFFVRGHHAHAGLIQREASGEQLKFSLIVMHAEDQLMNAETIRDLGVEIIEMHKDLTVNKC